MWYSRGFKEPFGLAPILSGRLRAPCIRIDMRSTLRPKILRMKNEQTVATAVDGRMDLFGHDGQAKMYRDFRPTYPARLVESIVSSIPAESRGLYVDVACGSGQLTEAVAPAFKASKGIDRSFEQLSHARINTGVNLEYVAGSALELPLDSGSVDLMTVAQGLHWLLPYDAFFKEVNRVLKPGGVFCAAVYAFPQLVHEGANAHVQRFYKETLGSTLSPGQPGCWWDTNRPTIDCYYADIPFPYETKLTHFPERIRMSVSHYFNYLRTLSAYRTLLRSGLPDPLVAVEAAVRESVHNEEIEVLIPFFTVSFAKPRK